NLEESPLPKSTKNGKDHLNQITLPSLDFKEKVVSTYSGIDITLYYRPIFCAIQALLQRPEVANNFVYKGILKKKGMMEAKQECLVSYMKMTGGWKRRRLFCH
ncbi:hypothetical protein RhiirC2_804529, partial [Rhizophagus irregularis]